MREQPLTPLTFGSLFAGIGGFDLGLERAGLVCKWQVEIDEFCQRVLMKHWPDVPKYRDVRDVGAHNLERVDVICGGFPCQDVSASGKRVGIGGKRSGLWAEYWRLIRELRPRYALVENVPGLLVRGMGVVLGDLAEIGYDAEWDSLPAADFGADHQRERVVVVAYPESSGRPLVLCDYRSYSITAHPAWGSADSLDTPTDRAQRLEAWLCQPAILGSLDGIPPKLVERELEGFGNAIMPQKAEWLGRCVMSDSCWLPSRHE